jgi:hypothetical protein
MASKRTGLGGGDLTTQILVQIRDEMRHMRSEQRATNERLDRLETRQTEDAMRLSTELVAVAKAGIEVRDLLRAQRIDARRLEGHERRLARIEKKIA